MGSFSNDSTVGTVTLKVKQNATGSGKVSFKNLAASDGRDDYVEGNAESADVSLTITAKQDANKEEENKEENKQDSNKEDSDKEDSNKEDANKQDTNTIDKDDSKKTNNTTKENTTDTSKDTKKYNAVSDNEKSVKTLPKTGSVAVIILPIIGVLSISSFVVYKKYNKYKGIK